MGRFLRTCFFNPDRRRSLAARPHPGHDSVRQRRLPIAGCLPAFFDQQPQRAIERVEENLRILPGEFSPPGQGPPRVAHRPVICLRRCLARHHLHQGGRQRVEIAPRPHIATALKLLKRCVARAFHHGH